MNLTSFSNSLKYFEEVQLILAIMFIGIIFLYITNIRISLNIFEFPIKKFIDMVFFALQLFILLLYLFFFYSQSFLYYQELLKIPEYSSVKFIILPQFSFYIQIAIFMIAIVDYKTQNKNWNVLYIKNIY